PPSPSSLSLGERGQRRWSPPPPLFSLAVVDGGDDESRRLLLSLSGVGNSEASRTDPSSYAGSETGGKTRWRRRDDDEKRLTEKWSTK
ncbi:hypothetical protein LINGRAHAP2_LOCUS11348, partial [Linum grandiflorum]